VVDAAAAAAGGVEVVRRRSGGGAVLVSGGDPLWVDLWLPRGDPLWLDDVVAAARWVGEWWASALREAGAEVAVHDGPSALRPWSKLICFAGLGPGEVVAGWRKVVGVAQWRCRQGALFSTCAYRRWDPRPLADLLVVPDRPGLADHLATVAAGTAEVAGPSFGAALLLDRLPPGPTWEITTA
jgi:lipoate-protein ligase A